MLMKKIMAVSHPDILLEGATDGGVNGTPDEVAFARPARRILHQVLQRAVAHGYQLGRPEAPPSGSVAEVRERRGLDGVLDDGLSPSSNTARTRRRPPNISRRLPMISRSGRTSIVGTPASHPGQLPPYKSIYAEWDANKPDWLPAVCRAGSRPARQGQGHHQPRLRTAAVRHRQADWETFLKGEEADPKAAMQKVVDAVKAEIKRG